MPTEDVVGAAVNLGKAERSLRSRDLKTHFESRKTGWSTLRRTFAALLPGYATQ